MEKKGHKKGFIITLIITAAFVVFASLFGDQMIKIIMTPFVKMEVYNDYEVGENFGNDSSSNFIKLPRSYCMEVKFDKGICRIFELSEYDRQTEFFFKSVYKNDTVISGKYVRGYLGNKDYAVFCEELEDGSFRYFSFDYQTEHVRLFAGEDEAFSECGFTSADWRSFFDEKKEG